MQATCKTCGRRHLLILHKINDKLPAKDKSPAKVKPLDQDNTASSCLANTVKETLYFSLGKMQGLLKVAKVLLNHGDRNMEAYAVLDDGSKQTILLHNGACQLGLEGEPGYLVLHTIKRDTRIIQGATVSFAIHKEILDQESLHC